MDAYSKELQNITSFVDENKELVESAFGLVAVSIMGTLNEFNVIESKVTTLIANYYRVSYSPKLDFKVDVLNSGYLSYGQKIKILELVLEKSNYYQNNGKKPQKYFKPLKMIGDLRNDIVHSVYGLNPEKIDNNPPEMIIYANGRKISKKDLLVTFSDFKKYYNESETILNDIAKYLFKEEENE